MVFMRQIRTTPAIRKSSGRDPCQVFLLRASCVLPVILNIIRPGNFRLGGFRLNALRLHRVIIRGLIVLKSTFFDLKTLIIPSN